MVMKKQKLLVGLSNLGSVEDRISKLPDPILHHILSFLPTKCVVCTSILSKRWRYVWCVVPVIDLRYWRSPITKNIHLETKRFITFWDKVLLLNNMGSKIQKFSLFCDELFDESRLNAWISALISRKIEELNLLVKVREPFRIPLYLFPSESLTKLKLQIQTVLCLPMPISFPRLKILWFTFIEFRDEYSTEQLFSNCPVLEELLISYCTWVNMKTLCISAPALKSLLIDGPETAKIDGLHNCEVKIYAPNLVSFSYTGSVAKDYVLFSFPSLVHAEIDFAIEEIHHETKREEIDYGVMACKLLARLSNVKRLTLSGETLEALSFAGDLLTNLPTFHNLIHLEISTELQYSTDKVLFYLLQMAPNLESLVFDYQVLEQYLYSGNDVWTVNMVPGYNLFLHLKTVNFNEFHGNQRELNLVELFVTYAKVLQSMTIKCSSYLSKRLEVKMKVMENLLSLPRSSSSCVINFS